MGYGTPMVINHNSQNTDDSFGLTVLCHVIFLFLVFPSHFVPIDLSLNSFSNCFMISFVKHVIKSVFIAFIKYICANVCSRLMPPLKELTLNT